MPSEQSGMGRESLETDLSLQPEISPEINGSARAISTAQHPDSIARMSTVRSTSFVEWLNWHACGSYHAATPYEEGPPQPILSATQYVPRGVQQESDAQISPHVVAARNDSALVGLGQALMPSTAGGPRHSAHSAQDRARIRLYPGQLPDCRCGSHQSSIGLSIVNRGVYYDLGNDLLLFCFKMLRNIHCPRSCKMYGCNGGVKCIAVYIAMCVQIQIDFITYKNYTSAI